MDLAIGGYDDLIGQIGIGGILGFVIGYAIKKILKFLLVLLGLLNQCSKNLILVLNLILT